MRHKLTWAGIGLVLLLLAGGGVQWFLAHYEQRTREIVVEISPMAKRNPLLAAARFLERIGVEAESVSGRDHLLTPPAEHGLLLVYRLGVSLPPEREQALLAWVRQGGHLLITPRQAWDEETQSSGNSLLDALGVQPGFGSDEDESAEPAGGLGGDGVSADKVEPAPLLIELPDSGEPLAVAFSQRRWLFDSQGRADWAVATERGAHLLQYQLGQGRITVVGELDMFTNDAIGSYDHALLLARLTGGQRHAWLIYSSDMPALPRLLWRHAPALVVSMLVLGLLLVWSLTRRSGPVITPPRGQRRNLMEHLAAAGRYLWRNDRAAATFSQSQAALEQAWRRRHPVLGSLQQEARCQWVAQHTGMSPEAVEQALYGECPGEQAFIQVTTLQQQLAAQLHRQKTQDSGENRWKMR